MGRFFCGGQQLALKCLEFKEQIHKFIFTQSAWSCEVHSKVTCESKMGCLAPCWIMIFMRSDPAAKMTDSAWLLNKILLKTATNVRLIWEHIYNKFRSASGAYSKPSAQHSWICSPSPFLTQLCLCFVIPRQKERCPTTASAAAFFTALCGIYSLHGEKQSPFVLCLSPDGLMALWVTNQELVWCSSNSQPLRFVSSKIPSFQQLWKPIWWIQNVL